MRTSNAVISTPARSGRPKSSFSATAEPRTSAKSHAAMAISQSTQRTKRGAARIVFAAGLRQVASGNDAELRGKRLQEHRHEITEHNNAEERVAEFRAALDVGGPVTGVHVADSDQIAGAGEREDFTEPRRAGKDRNGAVRLGKRRHGANARRGDVREIGRNLGAREGSVSNSEGPTGSIMEVNRVKYPF